MKKKIWIGILIGLIVVLTVGISVYRQVFAKGSAVKTAEAKTEEITSTIMVPGTLKLQDEQAVYSSLDLGEIDKILVKEGQKVKKGDVLAKYENPQLELELQQNKLSIESSNLKISQLNNQKKSLDKQKEELSKQVGKKEAEKQLASQYDQLEVDRQLANLELKQNLLQKETLTKQVKDLEIKSKIDGIVLSVQEQPSQSEGTLQEPAILVGNLNNMVAEGLLSEYDALKVQKGQKVDLTSDAVPDEKWEGEIKNIGHLPQQNTIMEQGTTQVVQYPITVQITSEEVKLKPGFQLIMEIEIEKKQGLVVPADAVQYGDQQTFVYVIKKNIAKKKKVEIGISSGDKIEIVKGLKKGEKVILNPSDQIEDGTEVTIK